MNAKQCTARSKRSGQRCKAPAVTGFDVCYKHGGATPTGIAAPSFKHGRYSKHLPENLIAAYQHANNDHELLGVREDIALLDTLLMDNLTKLDSGESGAAWTLMRKAVDALELAIHKEDYGTVLKTTRDMRDVIDQRIAHYATEQEIRDKLEQRRKLVESERKRMIDMEQVMTAEQAMILVSGLLDAIRRNVQDRAILTAIQAEFIRLTTLGNHQRINTADATD